MPPRVENPSQRSCLPTRSSSEELGPRLAAPHPACWQHSSTPPQTVSAQLPGRRGHTAQDDHRKTCRRPDPPLLLVVRPPPSVPGASPQLLLHPSVAVLPPRPRDFLSALRDAASKVRLRWAEQQKEERFGAEQLRDSAINQPRSAPPVSPSRTDWGSPNPCKSGQPCHK